MPPRTDSGSEGGSKQLAFPQWGLLRSLPTLNMTERCFDPSHPVHSVHFANYSYCRCLGQTSSCCCMETWISFEIWKNNTLSCGWEPVASLRATAPAQLRVGLRDLQHGRKTPPRVCEHHQMGRRGRDVGSNTATKTLCLQMFPLPTVVPLSSTKEDFS